MRSGVLTIIILLISAFTLLLGLRTDIKPQRHIRGYLAGLLLVSIPSALWLIWQKNLGNIELSGPLFGLNLNVVLALVLLPFVILYLWGFVKKFVGDKQLSILLPIFGIGLFGGFSLILLLNGARGFEKFATMSALVACVVLLFSKLLFTARFWSFQILLVIIWLMASLIASIFGHKILGKTFSISTLLVLLSFTNVFLIVFDWFDEKKTYLADEDMSLNNDDIEYNIKSTKTVNSEISKTKQVEGNSLDSGIQSSFKVNSSNQTSLSQERVTGQTSNIDETRNISNSIKMPQSSSNNLNNVKAPPIKIPNPDQHNIAKPILDPINNVAVKHETSTHNDIKNNFVQNSLGNNKSKEYSEIVKNLGNNSTEINTTTVNSKADNNLKTKESTVIKNDINQKNSKFRLPKVHFISNLLKFIPSSDLDHLTKGNNDFKMPVFGTSRKISDLNSNSVEPEFSVNIRTGETTIKNVNDFKSSKNNVKNLPKIKSNLNMGRTNFAIITGSKKRTDKQALNQKATKTNTIQGKISKNAYNKDLIKGKHSTNRAVIVPIAGSRITTGLQAISSRQPRQKRQSNVGSFRSNTTVLNIDSLSKIVGRYNSSFGKYIYKASLAIPYTSQETLDKIISYKNSLLKKMTNRNPKQLIYGGNGQDNLFIDRLNRTSKTLSTHNI